MAVHHWASWRIKFGRPGRDLGSMTGSARRAFGKAKDEHVHVIASESVAPWTSIVLRAFAAKSGSLGARSPFNGTRAAPPVCGQPRSGPVLQCEDWCTRDGTVLEDSLEQIEVIFGRIGLILAASNTTFEDVVKFAGLRHRQIYPRRLFPRTRGTAEPWQGP